MHDDVAIAAPADRRTRGELLIVQVLIEKEPRVELAERVLVHRAGNLGQRGAHRRVARGGKVRAIVHHLLRRLWQVIEGQLTTLALLEPRDKLEAVDVRKQQLLLNDHRGRVEERRALRLTNEIADSVPP